MQSMTVVGRFYVPPIRWATFQWPSKWWRKMTRTTWTHFYKPSKTGGRNVQVAITDGSPLYKDSLQRYWADIEHQLCIFHVIKEVHTLILDGGRAIKNRLKRQGHTGRQKRRGRPSKTAQKQRQGRQGMRKKEQAPFICFQV
jgi:hypothetical protein